MLGFTIVVAAGLAPLQLPQTDTLVADLNAETFAFSVGSRPRSFVTNGQTVYFTAAGVDGRELWATDGSTAGTVQVTDLLPGAGGPFEYATLDQQVIAFLPGAGDAVVFAAEAPGVGVELFRADGPAGPVASLGDLAPGDTDSFPRNFVAHQGELWFLADDGSTGFELWRTDGTAAGTTQAFDLTPGPATVFDDKPVDGRLASNGSTLLIAAENSAPPLGFDLLSSDGSLAGTTAIASFAPMSLWDTPFREGLYAAVGGRTLFGIVSTDATVDGIWATDGTAAGTQRIGPDLEVLWMVEDGARVFVASVAGGAKYLHVTDGTQAGTVELMGPTQAFRAPSSTPGVLFQGRLYLGAWAFGSVQGNVGNELVSTDGTTAGTSLVVDVRPGVESSGPTNFATDGSHLFFVAEGQAASGRELHRSDGTPAGTWQLFEAYAGTGGIPFGEYAIAGGGVPIVAAQQGIVFPLKPQSEGAEPWRADGSGAAELLAIAPPGTLGSGPRDFVRVGSRMYFVANLESGSASPGLSLMAWDVASGAAPFEIPVGGEATGLGTIELVAFGNGVAFTALEPVSQAPAVYWTDGGAPVRLTSQTFEEVPEELTVVGDRLFFVGETLAEGEEVFVSFGASLDTAVIDLTPGPFSSNAYALAALGDRLAFTGWVNGDNVGGELYFTDGTVAGTTFLDLYPGEIGSTPGYTASTGDRIFFRAFTVNDDAELWVSDGTAAGTFPVTSLSDPHLTIQRMEPFRDGMAIVADIGPFISPEDRFVILSDGTPAGTVQLNPEVGLALFSTTQLLAVAGETLFFELFVGNGHRLYRSDGTAAGTQEVVATTAGDPLAVAAPCSTGGPILGPAGEGVVALRLETEANGCELWISDGSVDGTILLAETISSSFSGNPFRTARVGAELIFTASDMFAGSELHAASLVPAGIAAIESIGTGCGVAAQGLGASGPAIVGQSFDLRFETGLPGAITATYIDLALAPLAAPGSCAILLPAPGLKGVAVADGNGLATFPSTVPALPSLVGLPLYYQGVAVDTGGPFLGLATLSNALEMVIGG